jgi:hypothetical protein
MTRPSSLLFLVLSGMVLGCLLFSAGCTFLQVSNQKSTDSGLGSLVTTTTAGGVQSGPSGTTGNAQCTAGQMNCRGNCVDTRTDHDNCGGCANTCAAGQVCQNSQCAATGGSAAAGGNTQCIAGQTSCSGDCVNMTSDHDNCGACGTKCGSGEFCVKGSCSTLSVGGYTDLCTVGLTPCSGNCVNTQNDKSNCGTCGNKCDSGEFCVKGSCATVSVGGLNVEQICSTGYTPCSGDCVNTQNDKSNCGACGNKCASGEFCVKGSCATVSVGGLNVEQICSTGYTPCSGTCVNTKTDTSNCGACGNKCGSGEFCVKGSCATVSVGGFTL